MMHKHPEAAAHAPNCLHLVLRPQLSVLMECLAGCDSGDCVVLMDAAVTLAAVAPPNSKFSVELCCLEADARAHGLDRVVASTSWTLITDRELVERVVRHLHCLSWK